MSTLTGIVAMIEGSQIIGIDGTLPQWKLPSDMAYFKKMTIGHSVIMGRKTWESLPEKFRPLPERVNIVMTRDSQVAKSIVHAGGLSARSFGEAWEFAAEAAEIFVMGGAEIYAQALPSLDRLEITWVRMRQPTGARVYFPKIAWREWHTEHVDPRFRKAAPGDSHHTRHQSLVRKGSSARASVSTKPDPTASSHAGRRSLVRIR